MTPECRNDCVEPLRFPRRPFNRRGLPHIEYRIGTFSDFREALLRRLNQEPRLAAWTHRGVDDPGIALFEGAAILGDILTFYQELYANEAYLRTAQGRESVTELVRLLGYRLSPGLGGRGTFAFEVSGLQPVVIPRAFPITAQLAGSDPPADFETTAEAVAYPWLGQFHLFRPLQVPPIGPGATEFSLVAPDPVTTPVPLERGDRLLLGDAASGSATDRLENAEIVVVEEVRELNGDRLLRIRGSLSRTTSVSQVTAYKVGRSFRHFGHNGPASVVEIVGGTATQKSVRFTRRLDQTTSSVPAEQAEPADPPLAAPVFPLDIEANDLSPGVTALVQWTAAVAGVTRLFTLVRSVVAAAAGSMTWGAVSGASTRVTLSANFATTEGGAPQTVADIRTLRLHEAVSPALTLRARPVPTADARGRDLLFLGTDAQVQSLKQRPLFLLKEGEEPRRAIAQAAETGSAAPADRPALRRVTLDTVVNSLDFPHEAPTVAVFGNLVEATQGRSEREEPLGNGDNREIFQTFKLGKSPLTYLNRAGETPPETPELQILVADRLWQLVATLFGHGPKDEIYIVREDENGDSFVQFGDGKTGARLPSGVRNVVARYRSGNGAFGALQEGARPQPGGRLDRLERIGLPEGAAGGARPESGEKAKTAAPGKVQSLDRLVSLEDFERETLAIPGVARAVAVWKRVDALAQVEITVLMETGRQAEIAAVEQILARANRCRGPQRFPVRVIPGSLRFVFLDASFAVDPTFREEQVIAAVKRALGVSGEEGNGIDGSAGLMAVGRRRFGDREHASRIEGTIQNVPGVLFAQVNGFGLLPIPEVPWPFNAQVASGDTEILSLQTANLQLRPIAVPAVECT